jgi:hypothetical protein
MISFLWLLLNDVSGEWSCYGSSPFLSLFGHSGMFAQSYICAAWFFENMAAYTSLSMSAQHQLIPFDVYTVQIKISGVLLTWCIFYNL